MPSQEDYLDELLKGLTGDDGESAENVVTEESVEHIADSAKTVDTADIAETADIVDAAESDFDMSEIEELLKAGADESVSSDSVDEVSADVVSADVVSAEELKGNADEAAEPQIDSDETSSETEDLMSLLEKAGEDSDLQDIHDMLQKSDNNEAVGEDLIAMLQELPDEEVETDSAEGELTERQKLALEKKCLKEEKAAKKRAAKEAKKAERLAKKLEKKAAKGGTPGAEVADAEPLADSAAQEAGISQLSDDPGDSLEAVAESVAAALAVDDALLNLSAESEAYGETVKEEHVEELAGKREGKEKKNLFSRILDFLTEEDEEEEETQHGTEDIPLSDENRQVLEEMDQEEPGKKGKKGKKAKKSNKAKKGKASVDEAVEGEDEEAEDSGADKKNKKAKKPKKEKVPKEKTPVDPRNKISLKKLLPIFLVGASLLFVIMLLVNFGGDFVVKREARKAFYEEDYETCYQELYGKKLNESEQVMFGYSESILRIRLWMREYELFADEGAEVEALDVLIQSVHDYAELYEYAVKWNADDNVIEVYSRILDILQDKYGLTEAQALEIAAEPDDVEYTRLVTAVAKGEAYGSLRSGTVQKQGKLPDMLPEEQQFPENNGGR